MTVQRKKMLKYAKKMLKYTVTDKDFLVIHDLIRTHSKVRFHHHMKVRFDGSKMPRVQYDPIVQGIIVGQGKNHASVKTKKYGIWRIPYERLSPR